MQSDLEVSPEALRKARMRLFIRPQLTYAASALIVSFLGAVAISATVHANSSVSLRAALLWPAMVAVANSVTMAFNIWSAGRETPDEELARITLLKSLCNILQGLAWGSGPQMLNVPGEAVTVVAPAWAMVTGVGVLVFSSAPWPPSSYTFITALFLPALVFLIGHGGALEYTIGVTMAVCFPFCLLIGRIGARYVGDLVSARLSVNALLERESRLSARLTRLNEERTRFFSSASHDLRQPLQALGFYTTLIGLTPGQVEQRELLSRLADCADTLDRQFNGILGVASTDAAVARAEPVPTLLDPIIRRAVAGHATEAERKGLKLRFVATRSVAVVTPEPLERILSNLIGNAVRYTRSGGIVVGVRPRGNTLAITVVDSGIGISEDDQARIFDDFYQVANPERNSAKGFGLGLAIVKRLAEGMEWPIRLTSRIGKGSIFELQVPRAATTARVPDPEHTAVEAEVAVSPLPVLVLDDDGLVRDAMARLLRSWKVDHHACATVPELMACLDQAPERRWCIILDHRLEHGVTGSHVLDLIQERCGDRHRFVFISGEADPELEELAHRRGVLLLRKPLKPIRLRAVLSGMS